MVFHNPCFIKVMPSQDIFIDYHSLYVGSVVAVFGILLQYAFCALFMQEFCLQLLELCILRLFNILYSFPQSDLFSRLLFYRFVRDSLNCYSRSCDSEILSSCFLPCPILFFSFNFIGRVEKLFLLRYPS